MLRRSSSLVTISLDNDETERQASTHTVIDIGDTDHTNYDGLASGSPGRRFQIVVDVCPEYEPTLGHSEAELNPLGTSREVKNCCSRLKIESFFLRGRKQLSEFVNASCQKFTGTLMKSCECSYLETYFLYGNVCGVTTFRIGKDHQMKIWLKQVAVPVSEARKRLDSPKVAMKNKKFMDEMRMNS
ncbi:unnamed protein product [Orchesella dallaii]|uniref:Uncharacterized protein n=1 Tax=Orchesella dallaii TaxID=48710 RepID=A0ABP1SB17_9HEXA